MNLRTRLSLLAAMLFIATLAVGSVLVVANARRAVAEEMQSTAELAAELLEFALEATDGADRSGLRAGFLERLERLENSRHLAVGLRTESGEADLTSGSVAESVSAPAWFVAWVEPPRTEFRRMLLDAQGSTAEIVVRADPVDEISEAWLEARLTLGLLAAFSTAAIALFYVLIGRWLRPLATVTGAIDNLQQGNYADRLPAFELPELDRVATHFNRMAAALEASRDENRRLTQRSLAIQEQERRALAAELHDELGQSISAIKALAVSIQKESGAESTRAGTTAQTIADISSHIYAVVRGMMKRLRPAVLDEFGLGAALEELVDRWNEHFPDTFCRLRIEGELENLAADAQINIYRIVQESLTNVGKHAGAGRVSVELTESGEGDAARLLLEIADDGVGLDLDAAPAGSGLGLRGICERAEALAADLSFGLSAEGGFRVSVAIPVDRARSAA